MLRKIFSAAVQLPNVILLCLAILGSFFWSWALLIGLVGIIFLTLRKANSESFLKDFDSWEEFMRIKQLDLKCDKLAEGPKNSTNIEKRSRVRGMLKVKTDIMNSLYLDKYRGLKQRIARQALELMTEYLHIVENYYSRLGIFDDNNYKQLQIRVNESEGKSSYSSQREENGTEGSIDIDKRLLEKIQDEKEELEGINSKLNHIESSMKLFEQYIRENTGIDNSSEKVDEIVNEAIALDNVMGHKKLEKIRRD